EFRRVLFRSKAPRLPVAPPRLYCNVTTVRPSLRRRCRQQLRCSRPCGRRSGGSTCGHPSGPSCVHPSGPSTCASTSVPSSACSCGPPTSARPCGPSSACSCEPSTCGRPCEPSSARSCGPATCARPCVPACACSCGPSTSARPCGPSSACSCGPSTCVPPCEPSSACSCGPSTSARPCGPSSACSCEPLTSASTSVRSSARRCDAWSCVRPSGPSCVHLPAWSCASSQPSCGCPCGRCASLWSCVELPCAVLCESGLGTSNCFPRVSGCACRSIRVRGKPQDFVGGCQPRINAGSAVVHVRSNPPVMSGEPARGHPRGNEFEQTDISCAGTSGYLCDPMCHCRCTIAESILGERLTAAHANGP